MARAAIVWACMALAARCASGEEAKRPEKAVFAGGCFWCMQPPFDALPGVLSTTAGYTGGTKESPTYREVSSGGTGHCEAVEVEYDSSRIGYGRLLEVFWRNVDPTDPSGQFVDRGSQYRAAIFYRNEEQRREAEASKAALAKSGRYGGKPIAVEIAPAGRFYPAEERHQKYYRKNSVRYKFYRYGSGRDAYLRKVWGGGEGH